MGYELVLVPKDYKKHISKSIHRSSCVMCGEFLSLVDELINELSAPAMQTEYEGLFSICPECETPHLELLSADVDFKGPVLIGWE